MLVLYRDNGVLYVRCFLKLKKDIEYKNHIFGKNKEGFEDFIEVDSVMKILTVNGDITIFNGNNFVKLGLVEFSDYIMNNKYIVEEMDDGDKAIEIPVIVEEKVEEIKPVEKTVEVEENITDNKKKRHKNQVQGDEK